MSVIAFHEKAGRSQVGFLFGSSVGCVGHFVSSAEFALTPCFHPHSRVAIRSLGACWAFSFQPALPSVYRAMVPLLESGTRARRFTQSPELGVLSLGRSLRRMFFMRQPSAPLAGGCAMVRTALRLPIGDAVTPPACAPPRRSLISSHSCLPARPTSGPSAASRNPHRTVPRCAAPLAPAGFADRDRLPC